MRIKRVIKVILISFTIILFGSLGIIQPQTNKKEFQLFDSKEKVNFPHGVDYPDYPDDISNFDAPFEIEASNPTKNTVDISIKNPYYWNDDPTKLNAFLGVSTNHVAFSLEESDGTTLKIENSNIKNLKNSDSSFDGMGFDDSQEFNNAFLEYHSFTFLKPQEKITLTLTGLEPNTKYEKISFDWTKTIDNVNESFDTICWFVLDNSIGKMNPELPPNTELGLSSLTRPFEWLNENITFNGFETSDETTVPVDDSVKWSEIIPLLILITFLIIMAIILAIILA